MNIIPLLLLLCSVSGIILFYLDLFFHERIEFSFENFVEFLKNRKKQKYILEYIIEKESNTRYIRQILHNFLENLYGMFDGFKYTIDIPYEISENYNNHLRDIFFNIQISVEFINSVGEKECRVIFIGHQSSYFLNPLYCLCNLNCKKIDASLNDEISRWKNFIEGHKIFEKNECHHLHFFNMDINFLEIKTNINETNVIENSSIKNSLNIQKELKEISFYLNEIEDIDISIEINEFLENIDIFLVKLNNLEDKIKKEELSGKFIKCIKNVSCLLKEFYTLSRNKALDENNEERIEQNLELEGLNLSELIKII